jgi:hypothetical protein
VEQPKTIPLNQGQQAAADGFFQFLFSDAKELCISGPGGVGKTYLMGYLIDEILPRYFETCKMMGIEAEFDEVVMTATTNQAAEVLGLATSRPAQTVHSFLHLKVTDDFSTGRSLLSKTNEWVVHQRKIIFCDEASMVDSPLRRMLDEGTLRCKIIYVGDHCQLAPVMEPISPIYRDNLPFFELTEPMRTKDVHLQALNQQLRNTVETGIFHPIKIVPGVIDWLNGDQMEAEIHAAFAQQTLDARILAYTNARVVEFNDHVRDLRGLPDHYTIGELLVNNTAVRVSKAILSVQEEVEILDLADEVEDMAIETGVFLQVRKATLATRLKGIFTGVPLPVDRTHYAQLVRYYQQRKNWNRYFYLKNTFPDLRQRDAATVHKAQGSTYDTVYIDAGNLSTCHQPNPAARLLYVGASRARTRVAFYGVLAEKYGGFIF